MSFDFTALAKLRARAYTLQQQYHLKHRAEQLWPYVTANDVIDQRLGLAAPNYTVEPLYEGQSLLFAQQQGLATTEQYQEFPYEWLPPHYMAVERVYQKGAFRYFSIVWQLQDRAEGGCIFNCTFYFVPRCRWLVFPIRFVLKRLLRGLGEMYHDIDSKVPQHTVLGFEAFFQNETEHLESIKALTEQWASLMPDNAIPQKMAHYIYTAPDKRVTRLRPFEVADYYQLDRVEVLRFCLLATRAGFLNLSWDLLCPSCQGATVQTERLDKFMTTAHCSTCNIQYDANFDQNVEVTFSPHERLRSLDQHIYCIANPMATPHIWAQLNFAPHQQRTERLQLPEGRYRLRSPALEGELYWQVVAQEGTACIQLALTTPLLPQTELISASELEICFHNQTEHDLTLKIEKLHDHGRIASAAFVTTLQDFRDLFSSEVLRAGVQLGIANIVLLFTDLKSSTELYETHGDARAFAFVQAHFDIITTIIAQHQGGVVKTIGDAVMGVFSSEGRAVEAILAILASFNTYNQQHDDESMTLTVKLGLHAGPCIMLNLNDRLDYFGSTVNLAARIEGMSLGNDAVLSASLFEHPEVQTVLEQHPEVKAESLTAQLKGIRAEQTLYRLQVGASKPL